METCLFAYICMYVYLMIVILTILIIIIIDLIIHMTKAIFKVATYFSVVQEIDLVFLKMFIFLWKEVYNLLHIIHKTYCDYKYICQIWLRPAGKVWYRYLGKKKNWWFFHLWVLQSTKLRLVYFSNSGSIFRGTIYHPLNGFEACFIEGMTMPSPET